MSQFTTDKNNLSELWISFIKGNDNAFSEIYKSSYKMLYSYALSFRVEEEQIRDIIQDLFVKIYVKPELVKESATLRPFLFKAIRNACLNFLKISQRNTNLHKIEDFDINFSVNENIIEDTEEQLRIKTLVKKILTDLTVRQREIIYLRFLRQMEYQEISQIMNMTEQASKNLIYRAMCKIRKENSDYDYYLFFILLVSYCK